MQCAYPKFALCLCVIRIYPSLQLIQMLQPRKNNLFTRLLYLARQENFVENSVDLIEVKHQIQLTHVPKKAIQHLYKKVYGLQVRELVIVRVDARTEEEACVSPVDDLVLSELDEVGLVLLVAGGDEAVDFAF